MSIVSTRSCYPPQYADLSWSFLSFKIDRLKLKEVLILVPLHRDNLTSYLSPILGQYGIRNSDFLKVFVDEFNKSTDFAFEKLIALEGVDSGNSLSDFELTVPVKLKIFKAGKYEISILPPHLGFLFSSKFGRFRRRLRRGRIIRNYLKLYKLALTQNNHFTVCTEPLNPVRLNNFVQNSYKSVRNALHKKL